MDDGSSCVEESIAMLEMAAAQEIRTVIATPHFYAQYDNPADFLTKRAQAENCLRQAMEGITELPQVLVGAEVYYFPGISEAEVLQKLTIDGKRGILVEMPRAPWTREMYRELEGIYVKQGLVPIVAHLDRYIRPFHTYGIPETLAKLPVMVQANASFFSGLSTGHMAMKLLREDKIHLLGSDCHNLRERAPNLGDAVQRIRRCCGSAAMERVKGYQETVLQNSPDSIL